MKTLIALCLALSGCAGFQSEPLTFEQRMELVRVLQNNHPYVLQPLPVLQVTQPIYCTASGNGMICQ